jgi:hypothetical protein
VDDSRKLRDRKTIDYATLGSSMPGVKGKGNRMGTGKGKGKGKAKENIVGQPNEKNIGKGKGKEKDVGTGKGKVVRKGNEKDKMPEQEDIETHFGITLVAQKTAIMKSREYSKSVRDAKLADEVNLTPLTDEVGISRVMITLTYLYIHNRNLIRLHHSRSTDRMVHPKNIDSLITYVPRIPSHKLVYNKFFSTNTKTI